MATEFKAQPCDVVHMEPFIPAKSDKPVTRKYLGNGGHG